jgi:hypothetical protein
MIDFGLNYMIGWIKFLINPILNYKIGLELVYKYTYKK